MPDQGLPAHVKKSHYFSGLVKQAAAVVPPSPGGSPSPLGLKSNPPAGFNIPSFKPLSAPMFSRPAVSNWANHQIGQASSVLPTNNPVLNGIKGFNQDAGSTAASVRTNNVQPLVDKAVSYFRDGQNLPKANLPSVDLSTYGDTKGQPIGPLYSAVKSVKPYWETYQNVRGGVDDAIDSNIPVLGEYHRAKGGIEDAAVSTAKNWAVANQEQLKPLSNAAKVFTDFEKHPWWQRATGATSSRPVIENPEDYRALQSVLNRNDSNDLAKYVITNDQQARKDLVAAAVNPISIGNITKGVGNAVQAGAGIGKSVAAPLSEAAGTLGSVASKALPVLSGLGTAGRAAATVGKGVSTIGTAVNAALEIPRMYRAGGVNNYLDQALDKQKGTDTPLSYALAAVNNINSPLATLGATGKLLLSPDTWSGLAPTPATPYTDVPVSY